MYFIILVSYLVLSYIIILFYIRNYNQKLDDNTLTDMVVKTQFIILLISPIFCVSLVITMISNVFKLCKKKLA